MMLGSPCSPCCSSGECVNYVTLFNSFAAGTQAPLTWAFRWGSSPPITQESLPAYWSGAPGNTASYLAVINNELRVRLVVTFANFSYWVARAEFLHVSFGSVQRPEFFFQCSDTMPEGFGTRAGTVQQSAQYLEVDGVQYPWPSNETTEGFCVRSPLGGLYGSVCHYTIGSDFGGSFGMSALNEGGFGQFGLPPEMAFSINITDPRFFTRQTLP